MLITPMLIIMIITMLMRMIIIPPQEKSYKEKVCIHKQNEREKTPLRMGKIKKSYKMKTSCCVLKNFRFEELEPAT